jgi:hypothetical protein
MSEFMQCELLRENKIEIVNFLTAEVYIDEWDTCILS